MAKGYMEWNGNERKKASPFCGGWLLVLWEAD
jgi:hypothetical protein